MTHERTNAITDQFEAWLRGYSPPRSMEGDVERQHAEKLSLLRIVLKFSPMEDFGRFITEALDECAVLMKTRAWPTQNELASAFRNHRKENSHVFSKQPSASDFKRDFAEITAAKMQRGEAVGEGWLYGILACEMIARRLIDKDTMTKYRSSAYFNRKEFYGEESAIEWEREAKESHERAKEVWRGRNDEKQSSGQVDLASLVKHPGSDLVAF